MFAIGLVPDGHDVRAVFGQELAGAQLGPGLVGEAVADTDGEFFEGEHETGKGGKTAPDWGPKTGVRMASMDYEMSILNLQGKRNVTGVRVIE